jgi:hypothetical protein
VNPFNRIGLETAALIIGTVIVLVLAAYLLGAFVY